MNCRLFATLLGGAGLSLLALEPALAQDAARRPSTRAIPPGCSISTVLVILMTIPGLALFYGGLVRTKNMLSLLTQVFAVFSLVAILWVFYGYSLAFTSGPGSLGAFIGGFTKAFLAGVTNETTADTFTKGVAIPEMSFLAFQLTFAAITPALIVGAFAERMKFSRHHAVHRPVAHLRLPADRPHGVVLGRLSVRASARSISPAARSCTSIPASPVSSARCWSASASATAAISWRRIR